MSQDYIDAHPDAPQNFLKAFKEAVFFYANNTEQANTWFIKASQLTFGNNVLDLAASVEPNLKAKTIDDVSITFSPTLINGMQEAADFIFKQGLAKKQIKISDNINQAYAEKANKELSANTYNPDSVEILNKQ